MSDPKIITEFQDYAIGSAFSLCFLSHSLDSFFIELNSSLSVSETDDPNTVQCVYKTEKDCVMKFTYSEHANGQSVLTALKEPGQYLALHNYFCKNCFLNHVKHIHYGGV